MRSFVATGSCESLKRSAHLVLGGAAVVCFGYNVIALAFRRQPHLALNVLVYGALAAFECTQIRTHCVAKVIE